MLQLLSYWFRHIWLLPLSPTHQSALGRLAWKSSTHSNSPIYVLVFSCSTKYINHFRMRIIQTYTFIHSLITTSSNLESSLIPCIPGNITYFFFTVNLTLQSGPDSFFQQHIVIQKSRSFCKLLHLEWTSSEVLL